MKPCRLIYKSVAQPGVFDTNSLRVLANNAANNNRRLGVCGILTISNSSFLQVLEGTPRFVNEIFVKIVKDERHRDIELISYEEIVKSEFDDWDMKLVELNQIDASIKNLLENKYPVENGHFKFTSDAFLMLSLLVDLKNIKS